MTILSNFSKGRASVLPFLFALSLGVMGCDTRTNPAFDADKLSEISTFYEAQTANGVVPGAAVLIYQGGEIVYEDAVGFADIAAQKPLKTDSLFRIYSMTKPIVTAATLQLIEQGLLDMDQPVADILPEFANMRVIVSGNAAAVETRPAKTPITIRHLLTHTAGFTAAWSGDALGALYARDYVYETVPYTIEDRTKLPKDLSQFGTRLAKLPLAHEPGAQMTYGLSSDVMGLVIERVTGKTLDDYLQANIFKPLGMSDTSFCVTEGDKNRLANLYAYDAQANLYLADAAATSVRTCPVGVFSGGSGLVSTLGDYLRFAKAIHNGGGPILSPESAAKFQEPQEFVDESKLGWWMGGTQWGLSVAQVEDPSKTDWKDVAGTYYWSGGASTYFWIDPRNDLIAMMFTQVERNGLPNTLKSNFRNLVYDAFTGAPYPGE